MEDKSYWQILAKYSAPSHVLRVYISSLVYSQWLTARLKPFSSDMAVKMFFWSTHRIGWRSSLMQCPQPAGDFLAKIYILHQNKGRWEFSDLSVETAPPPRPSRLELIMGNFNFRYQVLKIPPPPPNTHTELELLMELLWIWGPVYTPPPWNLKFSWRT